VSRGTKEVTLAGGNLFRVAAEQYGDALAWTRIAAANGMTDPFFDDTRTLKVPPPDPGHRTLGVLRPR
jgi:hypothetical protein